MAIVALPSRASNRVRAELSPHREALVAAQRALLASDYRVLATVRCELVGSRLCLCGTLPSYFLKQTAQELVLRLKLSIPVDNQVSVPA